MQSINDTNSRILVVDDQPEMRLLISRALKIAGFLVKQVASGADALIELDHQSYDLMILDIKMPDMDGIEVMRRVQMMKLNIDIIILTAAPSIESAVMAVRYGAADYLQKPITYNELIDSVNQSLHKRQARLQKERIGRALSSMNLAESLDSTNNIPDEIVSGNLCLERSQQVVVFLDKERRSVSLTRGETAVLSSLMLKPERVFSCAQLANQAWGYELSEDEAKNIIRPYISRLRSKLEPDSAIPQMIITVRGNGYYFSPPDEGARI